MARLSLWVLLATPRAPISTPKAGAILVHIYIPLQRGDRAVIVFIGSVLQTLVGHTLIPKGFLALCLASIFVGLVGFPSLIL